MSFQRQIVKNFATVGGLKYSGLIVSFFGQAYISRLISPSEYGVQAIVLIYYGVISVFLDAGISMALIREEESVDYHRGMMGLSLMIGGGLTLVIVLAAPFLGWLYNNPDITLLSIVYGGILLVNSLELPLGAILSKRQDFRFIAIVGVFSTVFSVVFTYFLARSGFSYWSLVWPIFVATFFRFFLYQIKIETSVVGVTISQIKLAYSRSISLVKNITLFRLLSYTSRNADNFYVSILDNTSALGFYDRAFSFVRLPVGMLTGVLSTIQLPMFQSLVDKGEEHRVKKEFRLNLQLLGAIGAPFVVLFHLVPHKISSLIWGEMWVSVGDFLLPLSILLPTTLMLNACGNMFVLFKAEKRLLNNSLISASSLIAGASAGAFFSIESMIVGVIIGSLLGSLPITMYLGCVKTFGFSRNEVLKSWAFNYLIVVLLLMCFLFESLNEITNIVLLVYGTVSFLVLLKYARGLRRGQQETL
ncbi:MAG: PST family polysaccharide transporter [Candidatus Endobugula sp.]